MTWFKRWRQQPTIPNPVPIPPPPKVLAKLTCNECDWSTMISNRPEAEALILEHYAEDHRAGSMCDYTTHVTITDDHTTCVFCGETIDDE